jgi:hypothetical protein
MGGPVEVDAGEVEHGLDQLGRGFLETVATVERAEPAGVVAVGAVPGNHSTGDDIAERLRRCGDLVGERRQVRLERPREGLALLGGQLGPLPGGGELANRRFDLLAKRRAGLGHFSSPLLGCI